MQNQENSLLAQPLLAVGRMEVSLYSAAAAMNATERWQDLVAENLSSASIPGARQREISFASLEAGLAQSDGFSSAHFVMPVAGTTTNFSQGELKSTGGNLDFALEGPGFFTVTLPDGSQAYTRNGQFQLDAQGKLTTPQGFEVASEGTALTFDRRNQAPIVVAPNGQVTQGATIKGKLAITEFGNLNALTMAGAGMFRADSPLAAPTPSKSTSVRQGFIEASNTSAMGAMASLITSMRMFESNQKVMTMQSDRMSKSISELSGTN